MSRQVLRSAVRATPMALLMAGSLVLWGCGGASVASLCEDECDCEGCSDAQLDDCIHEGERMEEAYDQAGCGDQFEDFMDCVADSFSCEDGNATHDDDCRDTIGECDAMKEPT